MESEKTSYSDSISVYIPMLAMYDAELFGTEPQKQIGQTLNGRT